MRGQLCPKRSPQLPQALLTSEQEKEHRDEKGSSVGRRTLSEKGAATRVLGHRLLQPSSLSAKPWQRQRQAETDLPPSAPAAPRHHARANVQLIVEDVQAGVEEKAGKGSNGDVWVLGRRCLISHCQYLLTPVSPCGTSTAKDALGILQLCLMGP